MKTKRFLSVVLAAAMTMQCAAFSVLADDNSENTGATLVASDTTKNWTMNWSNRSEKACKYYGKWAVENGLSISHDGALYKEFCEKYGDTSTNVYYVNENGEFVNKTTEGAAKEIWQTNANHATYLAEFNAADTASTKPLVVSYTFKSTAGGINWEGSGGGGTELAIGDDFKLFPNFDNKGLTLKYYNGSDSVKEALNIPRDDNYHDVKFVISPDLTEDGRYQMTAISVDGVIEKLENVYGTKTGRTENALGKLTYKAGYMKNSSFVDEIKNLNVYRGFDDITVTSSIADGATDVSDNVVLTFSEAVELADGAVSVYEGGSAVTDFSVTMGSDNKTATVALDSYKSSKQYRVVLDKSKVTGLLGESVANGIDVTFTTAIVRNVVASDKTTKWTASYNADGEKANKFYSSYDMTNGLKYELDKAKLVEFMNDYADVGTAKYYVDENGDFVNKNAENKVEKKWAYDGVWLFNEANFNINEKVADADADKPLVISYTYKSTNKATPCWANGPATSLRIFGDKGNDFSIYPNRDGNGLQINCYNGTETVNKQLGIARDDNYHDIKVVIAPNLTNGRYQMTAISVDGVVKELEDVYGKTDSNTSVALKSLMYKSSYIQSNNAVESFTDEIKNLEVVRGLDEIFVSSSVADGATDVKPENIKLSFTDAVKLADGAVKVLENGVEMDTAAYKLTPAADGKSVNLTISDYKSRTAYKVVVDNTKVTGLLGGKLAEGLTFEFVTAKKTVILEGSGENLAANYEIVETPGSGIGQSFTEVTTDEDGITTITVDNKTWNAAANAINPNSQKANADEKSKENWIYDLDGDGIAETLPGHYSQNMAFVGINGVQDKTNSTDPIVVSMEYSFENECSAMFWMNMNEAPTTMVSPFTKSPKISCKGHWDGLSYTNNVTEQEWHTVQYVIDSVPAHVSDDADDTARTKVMQVTHDGTVVNKEGGWYSYGTGSVDTKSTYLTGFQFRIFNNSTDKPTVIKIKNFKVLRAADLKAGTDDNVLSKTSSTMKLKFSDPVKSLTGLKVLKGSTEVENAIASAALADDGMSADVTLNLNATAAYSLVTSELESVYGVKSSTDYVSFEYYNTDGYVSITGASKSESGADTTVSFSFTSTKNVSPLVIVAAYSADNKLIKVTTKPVTLTSTADLSDSVTLEGVTGAARIQVMAWDSLEGMTPYCLAKDIK